MPEPTIARFRRILSTAYGELEARRQEINDLNVFPVADGDTGDNMALTMQAVLAELEQLDGRPMDEEANRDEIVQTVARAALMGARGNSGVILSQIVRGASEELASRPGELVDPVLVASAFARAADAAYDSVRDPAEGTILTVVREMAHAVAQGLAHMEEQRLSPETSDEVQDQILADVLERAVEAGSRAVERTPEQLRVLRESGVVDAGGHGLVLILAGIVAGLRRDVGQAPEVVPRAPAPAQIHLPAHGDSRFRYCTNFIVSGSSLDPRAQVPVLEGMGDSVLVVGDSATLRVHIHTDDPEQALSVFEGLGDVSQLDVADMREQVADRTARLGTTTARTGVVAVCSGAGMAALYAELGAHVVDGGATLNPSTHEILAGIHAIDASEALVLPNSRNVILAAERAAELSEKPTAVVPCTSQQAGLVAMVELDPSAPVSQNVERLGAALDGVRVGAVAKAARDDAQGRFRTGDAVGFVDEEIVAWGGAGSTLQSVITQLAEGAELITVVAGEGAPIPLDQLAADAPAGIELELHEGGQPSYWWLLAAQ